MPISDSYASYRRSKIGGLLFILPIVVIGGLNDIMDGLYLLAVTIILLLVSLASKFSFKFAATSGLVMALGMILKDSFSSPYSGGICVVVSLGFFIIFLVYETKPTRAPAKGD